MTGRIRLFVLSLMIAILITPANASARTHIGDELPASEYQIGSGINIEEEMAMEQNMFPGLLPDDLKSQCTWLQYPDSSYCFRSAPSQGKGLIDNTLTNVNSTVMDALANCFFAITKWSAYVGNNILLICFDDYFLRQSLDLISDCVREYASPFIGGDQQGFSGILFSICLIFLAIGIVFYILRAQLMKAITSILLSAVCVAFLLIYASNVHQILPPVLTFVNDVTGIAITSVSFLQNMDSGASLKNVDNDGRDISLAQASLVGLTNEAWFVLVSGAWANGQFGSSDYARLRMTEEEKSRANAAIKFAGNSRKTYTRNDSLKSDYIDTNYLASSEDVKDDFMTTITDPYIDHGQHQVTVAAAGAGSGWKHFMAALLSIPPALIYILLVILVGLPIFIAQFMVMVMLILMPVVLIVGIAGESGRAVLVKGLKALLGFLSTKVIYGFYLGFAIMLAFKLSAFAAQESKIGTAGFIVGVILTAAILFRKKFFNACMSLLSFAPGTSPATVYNKGEDWLVTAGGATGNTAGNVVKGISSKAASLYNKTKNRNSDEESDEENEQNTLQDESSEPSRTNRKQVQNEVGIPKKCDTLDEAEYVRFHMENLGHGKNDSNDKLLPGHNDVFGEHDDISTKQTGTSKIDLSKDDENYVVENEGANISFSSEQIDNAARGHIPKLSLKEAEQETNEPTYPESENKIGGGNLDKEQFKQFPDKQTIDQTDTKKKQQKETPINIKPPWQNTNEKTASETPQEERKQQGDIFVSRQTRKMPEKPNIAPTDNNSNLPKENKSQTTPSQSIPESRRDSYSSPIRLDDDYQADYRQDETKYSDRGREPIRLPGSRWYD